MTVRPDHDRAGQGGFLLAEMLATMLVSALALIAMVGLGGLMLRATDHSVGSIETTEDLGRTLLRLDGLVRDAQQARLDGVTARLLLFEGDAHRITFARTIDAPDGLPSTEAVTLRSEPDGRLYKAGAPLPTKLPSIEDLRFGAPELLYNGPIRFRFSYVDRSFAKAAAQNGATWPVGDRMPAAVEIQALQPGTGRVLASVRSAIASDADILCIEHRDCAQGALGSAPLQASAAARSAP